MASAAVTPAAPLRPAPALALGLVALVCGALFWPTFVQLAGLWQRDPNYSHGLLIPILSLILALRQFRRAGAPTRGDLGLGSLSLLAGCVVHLVCMVVGWPPLDFIGLALILRGIALTAGGRDWAAGYTFPILFLFFMFPLPVTWTTYVALWLQDLVSRISGFVLDLFFTCYQRGTSIYLAGVREPLVVAEECSGLRQMVVFVALGALLGYLSRRGPAFRILLVLAAVPIAILANVARVVLMGVGARYFGTDWFQGWLHDMPALFSVPFGLLLFLLVWSLLGKTGPAPSATNGGRPCS